MIRPEIRKLMAQEDRQPKTEREALTWVFLLQHLERDFFSAERNKPKLMDRAIFVQRMRARINEIHTEAVRMFPNFEWLPHYTYLVVRYQDLEKGPSFGVMEGTHFDQDNPPEIVADAAYALMTEHMLVEADNRARLVWERVTPNPLTIVEKSYGNASQDGQRH